MSRLSKVLAADRRLLLLVVPLLIIAVIVLASQGGEHPQLKVAKAGANSSAKIAGSKVTPSDGLDDSDVGSGPTGVTPERAAELGDTNPATQAARAEVQTAVRGATAARPAATSTTTAATVTTTTVVGATTIAPTTIPPATTVPVANQPGPALSETKQPVLLVVGAGVAVLAVLGWRTRRRSGGGRPS